MKIDTFYRPFLVLILLGQLLWFFFPWERLYSGNPLAASILYGADSLVKLDGLWAVNYIIFALYLGAYIGMYFYIDWARKLFAGLLVLGGGWIAISGVAVQSGYEAMFGYFLTLGDGLIIGLSFFSTISQRFSKR